MLDLKEAGVNGWCSAHQDVNGFHIRGPYAEPWVCFTTKLTCQYVYLGQREMRNVCFAEECWSLWIELQNRYKEMNT